jgi:hypothetical protein
VDRVNNGRLLDFIGGILSADAEQRHWQGWNDRSWRHNLSQMPSGKPGGIQGSLFINCSLLAYSGPPRLELGGG